MLRLDPQLAVFRTSPDRISVGAQQPIAELDADESTLRGIALLTRGVLRRELEHLLGDDAAAALVERLGPALVTTAPAVPARVRGRIPLALELHRALDRAGHRPDGAAVVVPVAPWRLPHAERERLLGSGAAHLPVVVGDSWVQVGPFVPAGGGCSECAPADELLLPAHLTPAPTAPAAAQAVVTVLHALRRLGDDDLPEGWVARIRQRDGAVSAVRRARPRRCAHRSLPGIATAA